MWNPIMLLGLVTAFGLTGVSSSCNSAVPEERHPSKIEVDTGVGTAIVRGVVVKNELGCIVDGQCYLVLAAEGVELIVLYQEAEGGSCLNIKAGDKGIAAKQGDYVEVFGAYQENGKEPQISTCPESDFYIRKLEPDS